MTRKNKYNNKETEMIPAWNGDIMRHPIALIIYKYAVRHYGIGNEFRLYNILEFITFHLNSIFSIPRRPGAGSSVFAAFLAIPSLPAEAQDRRFSKRS